MNPAALFPLNVNAKSPLNSDSICCPLTTSVKVWLTDAGGVPLSITVIPNERVPAVGAFALVSNPAEESVKPVGKFELENVRFPVPPVAAICSLYATPTWAGGKEGAVVNAKVLTTMFSGCDVADAPVASVRPIVNVELPPVVGLPTMFTVSVLLAASESPAGKLPETTVQLKGGTPPVAVTGCEYA